MLQAAFEPVCEIMIFYDKTVLILEAILLLYYDYFLSRHFCIYTFYNLQYIQHVNYEHVVWKEYGYLDRKHISSGRLRSVESDNKNDNEKRKKKQYMGKKVKGAIFSPSVTILFSWKLVSEV